MGSHRPGTAFVSNQSYDRYTRVQNDDPTNGYMYQMPVKDNKGYEMGGDGNTNVTDQSQGLE